jgi:hypothetical protein
MKIHKPSYNSESKLYTCDLGDGFRLTLTREEGVLVEDLEKVKKELIESVLTTVISSTKGWFSKPLTEEWLRSRINFTIPTENIPSEFEGSIVFQATRLLISKDAFLFECSPESMTPAEKLVIKFEEDVPELSSQARRLAQKQIVLKARAKAARALFRAEHITHEYNQHYGEDTDWEDDDSEV